MPDISTSWFCALRSRNPEPLRQHLSCNERRGKSPRQRTSLWRDFSETSRFIRVAKRFVCMILLRYPQVPVHYERRPSVTRGNGNFLPLPQPTDSRLSGSGREGKILGNRYGRRGTHRGIRVKPGAYGLGVAMPWTPWPQASVAHLAARGIAGGGLRCAASALPGHPRLLSRVERVRSIPRPLPRGIPQPRAKT